MILILPVTDQRERKHLMVILTREAIERLQRGQRCDLLSPQLEETLGVSGVIVRSARDEQDAAQMVAKIPGAEVLSIQVIMREAPSR